MGEDNLICLYHGLVVVVILSTAIVTLGGIVRRGVFSNINDKYIKILVVALLVEISAAFIGVYKTLPQLKFYKSEEYKFDISYIDILSKLNKSISEDDKRKLSFFLSARNEVELNSYNICKSQIDEYQALKMIDIKKYNIQNWEDRLLSSGKRCINFFRDETKENMKEFEKVQILLEKYARYSKSSNKTGKGIMYLSTKHNVYNGIATFRFPGDELYTVLEVSGQKVRSKNQSEEFQLTFEQAPSALSVDDVFIPRPGGKFSVVLKNTETSKDVYKGNMPNEFGEIRIALKN